nr:M20/M25/M40 family metallo-hydrolase [Pseudomonas sp. ANT_J28]
MDAIGNLFARRAGTDPDAAPVMMGSHLDTQPEGGRFDGVYGVLAGLEAVRCLNDLGIQTRKPLEVAVWTNEEGARFTPAMFGSAVFTGIMPLDAALAVRDIVNKSSRNTVPGVRYFRAGSAEQSGGDS